MKLRDLLSNWGLSSLKIRAGFLDAEFRPQDEDRRAAWDLYIELLTRITTQPLPAGEGVEEAALTSLWSLFGTTREVLKTHGPGCIRFSRIAIVVLNQVLRPLTTKWHGRLRDGRFGSDAQRAEFRADLEEIRPTLVAYARALAEIADVEDLTNLEGPSGP